MDASIFIYVRMCIWGVHVSMCAVCMCVSMYESMRVYVKKESMQVNTDADNVHMCARC